jgi:hypothetical protein
LVKTKGTQEVKGNEEEIRYVISLESKDRDIRRILGIDVKDIPEILHVVITLNLYKNG